MLLCSWFRSHILTGPSAVCSHHQRVPATETMTCRWHWLDIKCPSKSQYHSSPQLDRGGKISTKGSLIKIKTGRNHSQVTITGKTNLTRGNYFVTNKRIKNKTKLKALTLLLLRLYFAPHFFASPHHWHKGTGNGFEVIHHTLSLLFLSPQGQATQTLP